MEKGRRVGGGTGVGRGGGAMAGGRGRLRGKGSGGRNSTGRWPGERGGEGTPFEASPAAEGDREEVLDGGVARRKEKRGGGALWGEGALGECSRRGGGLG